MKERKFLKALDDAVHAIGFDPKKAKEKNSAWYAKNRPWLKWLLLLPFILAAALAAYALLVGPVSGFFTAPLMGVFMGIMGLSRYSLTAQMNSNKLLDERQMALSLRAYRSAFWTGYGLLFGLMVALLLSSGYMVATNGLDAFEKMGNIASALAAPIFLIVIGGFPLLPILFSEWQDRSILDE